MSVDRELLTEVEQFLHREAQLLDEGRFHEWLDLFTEDVGHAAVFHRGRGQLERILGRARSRYRSPLIPSNSR